MFLAISKENKEPLYAQITKEIKKQIASGVLPSDYQLPSIRELARTLEVSVITTKRAYEELESAGFIYSVPGKGSFVKTHETHAREEWLRVQFEEKLIALIDEGLALGLTKEEMETIMHVYIDEIEGGREDDSTQ